MGSPIWRSGGQLELQKVPSRECGALQAILDYAVAIEALDKNRLKVLPSPRWQSRERVVTAAELVKLFQVASDPLRRMMTAHHASGIQAH